MAAFVARRMVALVPLLLLVSLAVFSLSVLLPGDPARTILGPGAEQADVRALRAELRLDNPFLERYGRWLADAVQGDLGDSIADQRPVIDEIGSRFPVTLSMVLGGVVVALLIGVPLGYLAGVRRGTWVDRLVTGVSSLGLAMPDFWLAVILVSVFAVDLGWLPSIGYVPFGEDPWEWARHLLLPWLAIGIGASATIARQLRGALVDVLDADYIRTAKAKGLRNLSVVGKHAMKNAAMPATTVLGIQIAYLLGGTVIMEQIFGISGMGSYALRALGKRDLPVIQGVALLTALIFVLMNLLVDLAYGWLNPKVRYR